VTANITIVGNDGVSCNATMYFSNPGVFSSNQYTVELGDMVRGESVLAAWNLSVAGSGSTNITVRAGCLYDGVILERMNSFTVYNISASAPPPPNITIISPQNSTRLSNPVAFIYNISHPLDIDNCTLIINSEIVNTTLNPPVNTTLNFTRMLDTKTNVWEITCTDNSSVNIGSSGLYNLTLNSVPFITALAVDNPINLIAGSTKTVYCNGTAEDGDSYLDIEKINASVYFQGYSQSPDNPNYRYSNSSCRLFSGLDNSTEFTCAFEIEYYAQNGTWHCDVTVSDFLNATNISVETTTINELLAVGISPGVIDFGALEILQISPIDIEINITNYGNIMLDLNIYAYALFDNDNLSMDCTKGNISLEYQRFSEISGTTYTVMTPVNNIDSPAFVSFNLQKRVTSESKKPLYWKLQIPMYTGGTCSGKVVFAALPN
jgi:hypothetical protein